MKKIVFTDDEIKNIYQLYYNENKSFNDLGIIYGCCGGVFQKMFKNNGWESHSRTYKQNKYSVNEHYFDNIDTPDKAYCLGLFYADGCNHYEKGNISLELQLEDYDLVNSINNLISNTRPVAIYSSENNKYRKKDTCKMLAHSYYLSNKMSELNFIPRKSLTLEFPYWMNKDLIPYMLRGYIDGDGWVQKYTIGFMSTNNFCIGVKQYLESVGIEGKIMDMKRHYNEVTKTFYINNTKMNLIPLTEMMFSGGTISMKRKVDKYIKFGFLKDNNSLAA